MSDSNCVSAGPLQALGQRLVAATGCDRELDAAIAEVLDEGKSLEEPASYTASVDRCLELLHRRLSGWHWHLGYDAVGVMPYAIVADAAHRYEATAATVPLALLRAITQAKLETTGDDMGTSPG